MLDHRFVFAATRLSFGLFVLMTSLYCLLAYIPFTYYHFLQFSHLTWVTAFVRLHPFLYWLALGPLAASMWGDLRGERTRRLTLEFLIVHAAAGLLLVTRPLLPALQNDYISLIWSLVWLFPLVWMAVLDYGSYLKPAQWPPLRGDAIRGPFRAALLSGLFLSLVYAAIFLINSSASEKDDFNPGEKIVAIGVSLTSHMAIFAFLFVMLGIIRAISKRFSNASRAEFFLSGLLACMLCALVVRRLVLPTLTMSNLAADFYSAAVSGALFFFLTGIKLRFVSGAASDGGGGIGLLLSALAPRRLASVPARAFWLALLAAMAYAVPALVARNDWDFLIQKLVTLAVWAMTFAFFYSTSPREKPSRFPSGFILAAAVISFGVYRGIDASQAYIPGLFGDGTLNVRATLDRYSGYDLSFKVAREIITPPPDDDQFYSLLQANTSLPQSLAVDPVQVELAPKASTEMREKPHIFLFVIDSLRQDYLSPYNERVDFTPAIADFARESAVMKNSFTRYSGTALAQPSIWVGGLMLHKQYVTPFYPMNSLQKLIDEEGYQSYISVDKILSVLLRPSPEIVKLDRDLSEATNDRGRSEYKYDFCRTLSELQAKLDGREDKGRPAFAYTQPQNLHISVLLEHPAADDRQYPKGFSTKYASQVRRLDACFGEFIDFLKSRGMYDNSIVILTSDHGDALGEEGRWGHSTWIFPEVMRIPLLIHLPESMRRETVWEPDAIAFSTDITPSLYYLLGRRPIARNKVFGRPLFTKTLQEQAGYANDSYLVCSSYGPAYGILKDNGRSFYIIDGVDQREYFFDLGEDPAGRRNLLNAQVRAENQALIRDGIRSINEFYNFGTKQEVASLDRAAGR
ncbi:MAG TPA: sulfatase-like hydrolase/transferase [Blastocatellia bacterium]|nr:sulfatase-like hydrolase/transferase [Blastocatellia bacterium]